MKTGKIIMAAAVMGLIAPAGMAAVRPSVATNVGKAPLPVAAGARVGAVVKGKRSGLTHSGAVGLGIAGAGGVGLGIAAASGAFDSKQSTSP